MPRGSHVAVWKLWEMPRGISQSHGSHVVYTWHLQKLPICHVAATWQFVSSRVEMSTNQELPRGMRCHISRVTVTATVTLHVMVSVTVAVTVDVTVSVTVTVNVTVGVTVTVRVSVTVTVTISINVTAIVTVTANVTVRLVLW